MTFLAFCSYSVVEHSTFLLVFICTDNFAITNTTSTNRFNYISDSRTMDISDSKHSLDFLHGRTLDTITIFKAIPYGWRKKILSETKRKFECWHNIRLLRFNTPFRVIIKRINIRFLLFFQFFFLSGFNIHESQDCRGRRRTFL